MKVGKFDLDILTWGLFSYFFQYFSCGVRNDRTLVCTCT